MMMNIKIQTVIILLFSLWNTGYTSNVQAETLILSGAQFFDKNIDVEDGGPAINPVPHQKHRRFIPFARPLGARNSALPKNNTCSSSEEDFPYFLSDDTVKNGGFIICIIIGVYCFTLLAVVCGNYFLPCVETICEIMNLSPDVAAATFMSVATSCPELFTNIIATFVTDSDLGIGTIVGSSLFNGLGVAAIGGLAAPVPLQLDWWPLTRDCSLYICSVTTLVIITWDGIIQWYEALVLMIIYILYFIIIFQSIRLARIIKSCIGKSGVQPAPKSSIISAYGTYAEEMNPVQHQHTLDKIEEEDKKAAQLSLFRKPEGSKLDKFLFYYTWPLLLLMSITIPNPKLHPRLFPLTFIMCIIWIGCNAYVVSWMISIIGNQLGLPDAVLGMTFLAAGGCLPESISMTIISRRGEGAFGVSNSLGANSMNILLSLGMPWFFKTIVNGANDSSAIHIESGSIEYTILALIFVSISLYCTLAINKFRLGKIAGCILLCVYITMVVLAILSEMVFFDNKKC